MPKLLSVGVIIFILFSGCKKLDPKIDVPSYIEISDYKVITDSVNQGTSHQKFTDVLVTSGSTNYGYYPIPCKIPLPLEGATYLIIRPVMLVNGVKFLRFDYPVMKGCDSTFPLRKGEVLKVNPVFKYFPTAVFPVVEDFENNTGFKLQNASATDTFCTTIDTSNAVFGNKCLSIKMDAAHSVVQVNSTSGFTLPNTGPSTYLEFNYKGNFTLEAGLVGSNSPGTISSTDIRSAGGVNPTDTWKKMYIDLTPLVRTPPFYNYYFLYFYSTMGWGDGSFNPQMYIDNVKVVHL